MPKAADTTAEADEYKERFIQNGSATCITNAREIISLIHDHGGDSGNAIIDVIPWWQRIFYLHTAGVVLIAAMLQAELFTPAVSGSWLHLMALLKKDEHLSHYNQQCVELFDCLASKLSGHLDQGKLTTSDTAMHTYFEDMFRDAEFNPDNFLFGEGDAAWFDCT